MRIPELETVSGVRSKTEAGKGEKESFPLRCEYPADSWVETETSCTLALPS